MSGHAERAHAKLSASGSSRWLACTGSVQLEEQFPDTTTSFAEEGTAAHELSEIHLRLFIGDITKRNFNSLIKKAQEGEYYSQEMEDYVQVYVDYVVERINGAKAKSKDAVVLLERRLDFSKWVPDGYGTGDVVIIYDGVVEVIDLKYGKGVPVSAVNNSQARLYGLGAWDDFDLFFGIDTVIMTIVQPRLDNISTDEMAAEDLLTWAEEVVKPKAQEAMSGEGDLVAGDHCKFCKARFTCRERAEANLEIAKYEFQESGLLTAEEIADILNRVDELVKWAGEVKDYALDQAANHGVKYPGFKLVEGRSSRKYTDEDAVAQKVLSEGYFEENIYEQKLLTITKMEKLLGKKLFNDLLSELVIKPMGKPVLVEESDKRPELNSVASAQADFTE